MGVVVALLLAGLLLLALETVLPGLVAGALGLCCLMGGVVFAYTRLGIPAGNITLVIVIGMLVCGAALWIRFLPRSWVGRRFTSEGEVGDIRAERPDLLNATGTAITTLRPSGMALIHGQRIDVVTEGSMVERGSPVRVIAVEGMRVVVRPNPTQPPES